MNVDGFEIVENHISAKLLRVRLLDLSWKAPQENTDGYGVYIFIHYKKKHENWKQPLSYMPISSR